MIPSCLTAVSCFMLFDAIVVAAVRFEIVFEGAGFEEVPLDETNLLVSMNSIYSCAVLV